MTKNTSLDPTQPILYSGNTFNQASMNATLEPNTLKPLCQKHGQLTFKQFITIRLNNEGKHNNNK